MKIPFQRGEEVQLEVAGAAFEGKTVARLGEVVIFVEGAVPGDTVRARISSVKRRHAEARVVEVLIPSPSRVTARCAHFGVCGGCKWQHVSYEAQLRFKEEQVRDLFQRIGGFESAQPLPIIGADDVYFYRNKMEYSFSTKEWLPDGPKSEIRDLYEPIGSHSRRPEPETRNAEPETRNTQPETHNPLPEIFLGLHVPQRYDKVLEITECHLQSDVSNQILNFTRSFARRSGLGVYDSDMNAGYFRFLVIRQSKRTGELMVNLVTFGHRDEIMRRYVQEIRESVPGITTIVNTINSKKSQIAFGDVETVYFGEGIIHERLGTHTYTISPGSFFQTNTVQAERLYGAAKELAGLSNKETVYDFYCGTGTIAMFIADSAAHVVGIESVESSVKDAERNARFNGIQNCSFLLGDLKERLRTDNAWMKSYPRPDLLIIDPPRSGMHPKVIEEILRLNVPRIVYISCNPSTQARDARLLCEGQYALRTLQPVDMFPHTYHIENIALFELK